MTEIRTMELAIDGIDWELELGEAADGTLVFPNAEGLKQSKKIGCWKKCGIVRVKATFELIEWVEPQNLK